MVLSALDLIRNEMNGLQSPGKRNNMFKKLILGIALCLAACSNVPEPRQAETFNIPPYTRGSYNTSIETICWFQGNDVVSCKFHNGSYSVSSSCVSVSAITRKHDYVVFTTDPICSANLSNGDIMMSTLDLSYEQIEALA